MSLKQSQACSNNDEYGFLPPMELTANAVPPRIEYITERTNNSKREKSASRNSLFSAMPEKAKRNQTKELADLNERVSQIKNRLKHIDYQKERTQHQIEFDNKRQSSIQLTRQKVKTFQAKALEHKEKEKLETIIRRNKICEQNRITWSKLEQIKTQNMLMKAKNYEKVQKEKNDAKLKIEEQRSQDLLQKCLSAKNLHQRGKSNLKSSCSFITKNTCNTDASVGNSGKAPVKENQMSDNEYSTQIESLRLELESLISQESEKLDGLQAVMLKASRAKSKLVEAHHGSLNSEGHPKNRK
jgi:hypothetical protein